MGGIGIETRVDQGPLHLVKSFSTNIPGGRIVSAIGEIIHQGRATGAISKRLDDDGRIISDKALEAGLVVDVRGLSKIL